MAAMASRTRQRSTRSIPSSVITSAITNRSPKRSGMRQKPSKSSFPHAERSGRVRSVSKTQSLPHVEPELSSDSDQDLLAEAVKFIDVPQHPDHAQLTDKKEIDPEQILRHSLETCPTKVYTIELHGLGLTSIEHLENFVKVRVLDLSCNRLTKIENLENNRDLRDVKLYDNRLTEISNMEGMTELCNLQLQHNKIQTIGRGLMNCHKLKVLRLDSNYLYKLDVRELASCSALTSLDLSNNKLDNITAVNCLPNLEELFVVNNRLRAVADLTRCTKLQEVDLSHNRITNLSGLKGRTHLMKLQVACNQLTSLKSLGKLNLQELNISGNRFSETAVIADSYRGLQALDISDNALDTLDSLTPLGRLGELAELSVTMNPFNRDGTTDYREELEKMLPVLDVLDGVVLKKLGCGAGTPLMRPMTASAILSAKQVESQLTVLKSDIIDFQAEFNMNFDSLQRSLATLPVPSASQEDDTHRPVSRCGKRSRIKDALAFAESQEMTNSTQKTQVISEESISRMPNVKHDEKNQPVNKMQSAKQERNPSANRVQSSKRDGSSQAPRRVLNSKQDERSSSVNRLRSSKKDERSPSASRLQSAQGGKMKPNQNL